jgi:hypothetical protein
MKSISRFSLVEQKEYFIELIKNTDQQILAAWAIDCTQRVLPHFENKFPDDRRPRNALVTLRQWLDTGTFRMAVIRKSSLDAHAAARDVGEDNAARSAAHAAGQAVAIAHVPAHAIGAAIYALKAVFRVSNASEADAAVNRERNWQRRRLLELKKSSV